jgi:hypothetical protein
MGMRSGLGWRTYKDFDAEFKVRFVQGSKAALVVHGQSDGVNGYVFELVNKNQALYIRAYILKKGALRPFPEPEQPEQAVSIGTCCEPGDAFVVDLNVRGNQFQFAVTLNRKVVYDPGGVGLKIAPPEFTDNSAAFKHGNVGLLQLDSSAESRVERWCVSPWPLPAGMSSCIKP